MQQLRTRLSQMGRQVSVVRNVEHVCGRGDPLLPAHYPLTCLRNIHFKNINGEAQSAGTMYGFKEAPFGNDTFFFENCHIKAQKGLSISNVANVNFKGLELEIKEGEKIYERSANKDK